MAAAKHPSRTAVDGTAAPSSDDELLAFFQRAAFAGKRRIKDEPQDIV